MSENNKRFLLIVPFTYPEFSGSGLNAFRFARYLVNNQYHATLLSFNRNKRFNRHDLIEQVSVRRVLYFNRNKLLKLLSLTWIIPVYMIQVIYHDVIYLYGSKIIGYEFVVLIARFLGKKVVFQSLLAGIDDPESIMVRPAGGVRPFYKFIMSRVSIYHSINAKFTGQYRELLPGRDNWVQCAQGVDTDHFYPVHEDEKMAIRESLDIPPAPFIILAVGFVIERKRFGFLIDILSDLDIPFLLLIVGEYEYTDGHFLKEELEVNQALLKEGQKRLGDRLRLMGPRHDIENFYRLADIYIHPAIREGLPNAILEAMACGLPVISSRIPGLEDFILFHNTNCLLADDREEFIHRIKILNSNRSLFEKIGKGGRAFIEQNASFGNVLEALESNL